MKSDVRLLQFSRGRDCLNCIILFILLLLLSNTVSGEDPGWGTIVEDSSVTEYPLVSDTDTSDKVTDVAVSGNYAYIVEVDNGLSIFDLSDKLSPVIVGNCSIPANLGKIVIKGDYAYITTSLDGLFIVDITDNTKPQSVGHYDIPSLEVFDVDVISNYAYLAARQDGLLIIDITNKSNPIQVNQIEFSKWVYGISINGNYAYVAASDAGLRILDISNKTNPTEVGYYQRGSSLGIHGVEVYGDYAYIHGTSSIYMIDINDKSKPIWISMFDMYNAEKRYKIGDIVVDNNIVYSTAHEGKLVIIDFQDFKYPKEIGYNNTPDKAFGITTYDGYAYIALYGKGFGILQKLPSIGNFGEDDDLSLFFSTMMLLIGVLIFVILIIGIIVKKRTGNIPSRNSQHMPYAQKSLSQSHPNSQYLSNGHSPSSSYRNQDTNRKPPPPPPVPTETSTVTLKEKQSPTNELVTIECPGCQARMQIPKLDRLQQIRCDSCDLEGELKI